MRHVPASPSPSAAWASFVPWLEPGLGRGAAPQQGASSGAMGLWRCQRCQEAVRGGGSDGGRILHPPPLSRLLVATATWEQEHHFDRILLGRGEAGCVSGRGEGRSQGSMAAGVRRGLSQFPQSPWRTLPPVFPPQTQSRLQIHAGMNILSPPRGMLGVAGPCWAWSCGHHPSVLTGMKAATPGHILARGLGAE